MSKQLKETLSTEFETVESSATKNNLAVILNELNVVKGTLKVTPELIEQMAASGISMKNCCSLIHKSFQYFSENPIMLEAFERGRATLGSRVRGTLVEAALDNNNIQSAIYLDKILTQDQPAAEVNITVGQSQLSTISDEDLLKVAFTVESSEDTVVGNSGEETLGGGHTPAV